MKYYIKETLSDGLTAGFKARDDIDSILETLDYKPIAVNTKGCNQGSSIKKIFIHFKTKSTWNKALAPLKRDDLLFVQYPINNRTIFMFLLLKKIIKKGVKVIIIIHDLETRRLLLNKKTSLKHRITSLFEEKSILKNSNVLIVHNHKMKKYLYENGYKNKLVELGLFDYLIPNYNSQKKNLENNIHSSLPVIIAGNLAKEKAGYIYKITGELEYNLYGVNFKDSSSDRIHYEGAFPADELPFHLKGSFGLVWDGESTEGCKGIYGEYLKVNNPHKVSLYLASGIPIIIWKKAALSNFIIKNNLGFAVDDLNEIDRVIDQISEKKYNQILLNVNRISENLRSGYYLKSALAISEEYIYKMSKNN